MRFSAAPSPIRESASPRIASLLSLHPSNGRPLHHAAVRRHRPGPGHLRPVGSRGWTVKSASTASPAGIGLLVHPASGPSAGRRTGRSSAAWRKRTLPPCAAHASWLPKPPPSSASGNDSFPAGVSTSQRSPTLKARVLALGGRGPGQAVPCGLDRSLADRVDGETLGQWIRSTTTLGDTLVLTTASGSPVTGAALGNRICCLSANPASAGCSSNASSPLLARTAPVVVWRGSSPPQSRR